MNWFLIALGATLLWAIVNIIDDFLVSKYSEKEKERSSGGLVLFSSLIGLAIAFFILFFKNGIFNISNLDKILLFVNGGLTITWIILYLYALEIEEVSNVVPWFLMVPVFGYVLGYFFLGETLTINQMIGSGVIVFGSFLISLDYSNRKNKIKIKPVIYMLGACIALAVSGFIFKFVTIDGDFWVSSFWEYLGLGFLGLLLYLFVPKYRNEFLYMNKKGGKKIFLVNIFSEIMSVSGNLLTNFALLLAPISMVFLVGTFQPAIVLILAFLGTKFLPHIIKENISRKVMIPKIFSIIIMIIGSIFLFI